MSLFKQMLAKEAQTLSGNQGNFENDRKPNPYNELKHPPLRITKDNPDLVVRILPPKDENTFFSAGFQQLFVDIKNANGKNLTGNRPLTLPLYLNPEENVLDRQVKQWEEYKSFPNKLGYGPSTRYLINVAKLTQDSQGGFVEQRDPQGNLMVQTLQLPKSAYEGIIASLQDEMLNTGMPEYGFISAEKAYPVRISRSKGTDGRTQYNTQVYSNVTLGPLPQGWENELEDLNYQATSSEELDKEYIEYLVAVANGQEEEYNANRGSNGNSSRNGNQGNTPQQGNFNDFNKGFGAPANQNQPPVPPTQPSQPTPNPASAQSQAQFGQNQGQGQNRDTIGDISNDADWVTNHMPTDVVGTAAPSQNAGANPAPPAQNPAPTSAPQEQNQGQTQETTNQEPASNDTGVDLGAGGTQDIDEFLRQAQEGLNI